MSGRAAGGDDILRGGDNPSSTGHVSNLLFGDGETLSDSVKGGNDTLTAGNVSGGFSTNTLYGDAKDMSGKTVGGDDILKGGDSPLGSLANVFFGDAEDLSGSAKGGNDTLIGGTSSNNTLIGDARNMSDGAVGGDDVLIARTAISGANDVFNLMWGDAQNGLTGLATGGADLFVFQDNGSMTVGIQNSIRDFSQSQHDKIQFSGVAGVSGFGDLTFDTTTKPESTIIHAGADEVELFGFRGTLTSNDFLFG
jgi:hypothetical protein